MRRLAALPCSLALALVLGGVGCGGDDAVAPSVDAAATPDAQTADAKVPDAAKPDAPVTDSGATADAATLDAGPTDASALDALAPDAPVPDGSTPDAAAVDAVAPDAATPDTATPDTAAIDAATPDAATPDVATPDAAEPDAATPDAAEPDAATPDVSPDTAPDAAATACGAIQCKKLFDLAAGCIPMGACTKSADNSPNICFANGVEYLNTFALGGTTYTITSRVNKADGTTECYSLVTTGSATVPTADINYTYKAPGGATVATGITHAGKFTLICDEGMYEDIGNMHCPGTEGASATGCTMGTCQ
jgi:hypothetical protein